MTGKPNPKRATRPKAKAKASAQSGLAASAADRGVSVTACASVCTPGFNNDASQPSGSIICDAPSLTEFDNFFSQSDHNSAQFGPNGLALKPRISGERNPNARPGSQLVVPSVSASFCDKRRRLLSTPLITGYYVSDRPPDGQTHNYGGR